jgi:AcrR family transcriptional regulator
MPKIVDHDARRGEYVDALWRVVSRDGAGAISVRAVAAEAGVSASNVVHYLPSRAAMLGVAVQELLRVARERVPPMPPTGLDLDIAVELVMVAIPHTPVRRKQS